METHCSLSLHRGQPGEGKSGPASRGLPLVERISAGGERRDESRRRGHECPRHSPLTDPRLGHLLTSLKSGESGIRISSLHVPKLRRGSVVARTLVSAASRLVSTPSAPQK